MKKVYIYLTCIGMAVLAVACSKNESQLDPTKPEVPKEANIGFGSAIAKAPDAIVADESKLLQVRVYDYYTASDVETEYIKDLIQEATTEGAWAFVSENEYAWKKGAHKFFGWVEKDEAGAPVPNLDYANKVLSVGTAAAPVAAADYRYSEITAVNWPDNNMIEVVDGKSVAKSVSLNVKHLTSALTFSVKDYSFVGDVLVNSVSVGDVKTKGSATVDYSGATQAVTYSLGDETGAIAFPLPDTTPFTRESETDPFVFNGDTTCVWPQEYEDLKLTVKYTAGGSQKTITVDVPNGEWEAGKVYNFDLQIVNKTIVLKFIVQPWDASEEAGEIDTASGSINMSNVTWMNTKVVIDGDIVNTVNNSAFSVYMYHKSEFGLPVIDPTTKQPVVDNIRTEDVYGTYPEDVYETYEEDVIDEDTGEVIHKAGDQVLDEDGNPIIIHNAGDTNYDDVIHRAGDPIYASTAYTAQDYFPAQGYFTVNYPSAGLFKIGLIPAYGETSVDASKYQIMIYDNTLNPAAFRAINPDGEPITNDTVYFQVRAAANQDGAQHKAQIDIWFKPAGENSEWISAYSEIRANYALTISATS